MVAERFRARVAPYVARLARPFEDWRPDRLSVMALVLAFVAASLCAVARFTTPLVFLPVSLLVFLSGVFDVLDGEVARRTGLSSPRGDFLDHALDRYADMAILLGLAVSGFALPELALLALVSLLLTSYMGTQAQAILGTRVYGGLLTRADRLLLLALATFLEFDLSLPWPWAPSAPWKFFHVGGVAFTVIDLMLVYFVVAGQWTAASRAWRTWRSLPPAGPSSP